MHNSPLALFLIKTFDTSCPSPRVMDVASIVGICVMSNSSLLKFLFFQTDQVDYMGLFY
jgi:hypothetical protein